jgi:hypothetical protein
MRIFHGPQNIGGMAGVLARAQRELGYDAEAICFPTGRFEFDRDELVEPGGRARDLEWMARTIFARQPKFDVYHFSLAALPPTSSFSSFFASISDSTLR